MFRTSVLFNQRAAEIRTSLPRCAPRVNCACANAMSVRFSRRDHDSLQRLIGIDWADLENLKREYDVSWVILEGPASHGSSA